MLDPSLLTVFLEVPFISWPGMEPGDSSFAPLPLQPSGTQVVLPLSFCLSRQASIGLLVPCAACKPLGFPLPWSHCWQGCVTPLSANFMGVAFRTALALAYCLLCTSASLLIVGDISIHGDNQQTLCLCFLTRRAVVFACTSP